MSYLPHLKNIEKSYLRVIDEWDRIDDELDRLGIGRKDTPFDETIMGNMMSAWEYLDQFIREGKYDLLSDRGGPDMLEINHRVHYGEDYILRSEYRKALEATTEKFSTLIRPMREYYRRKTDQGTSCWKIAAELFIAIVGQPQLFIEGNHRSGSVIASWVNLVNGKPPFVLNVDNAIAYFSPAQEIKKFNKRAVWRSLTKLPKYKRDFREFWENHCEKRYMLKE